MAGTSSSVKKQSARTAMDHAGGFAERSLALFLLVGGLGGLGGLRLGHALLEFVDTASRIDEFLLAGVKGMTGVANTNDNHRLSGPGFNHVAAGATDLRVHIFRMYILFHK